jgi:hypothetical protein
MEEGGMRVPVRCAGMVPGGEGGTSLGQREKHEWPRRLRHLRAPFQHISLAPTLHPLPFGVSLAPAFS